jgi:hypothetical protein
MTKAEKLYHDIGDSIPDATKGKMFGALCIKAPNGKAGVMYWTDKTAAKNEFMIFKLDENDETAAMKLKGAKTFEPAVGRKMNGWIQLSTEHLGKWKEFAKRAMNFVKGIDK